MPTKIDIGPVYTQDPEKRAAYKGDTAASGFKPVERELVIDIDLTDYDDVRNSASGTSMSRKCWSLMRIAIQVCALPVMLPNTDYLHEILRSVLQTYMASAVVPALFRTSRPTWTASGLLHFRFRPVVSGQTSR